MKPQNIFNLVVRLSGYFAVLFAVNTVFLMVFGPFEFRFKGLFLPLAYAALGLAIVRAAPVVGAFAYPNDPVE